MKHSLRNPLLAACLAVPLLAQAQVCSSPNATSD